MNIKGQVVRVRHCDRSKWMTLEFRSWIDKHKDESYYVLEDYGNVVRLKGVHFLITKEFIDDILQVQPRDI